MRDPDDDWRAFQEWKRKHGRNAGNGWGAPTAWGPLLFLFVLWLFWYSGHPIALPGADLNIGRGHQAGDWMGGRWTGGDQWQGR